MRRATESTLADTQQVIANLQRQLDERTAERDALRRELADAREQQTATAELLQVINSSPDDLAPVFGAMLEKAIRLCDAAFGVLHTFDGKAVRAVALRNLPEAFAEYSLAEPLRPDPERSFMGQAIYQRRTIHIADNAAEEPYRSRLPTAVAAVELGGIRTLLHVPLIKDDTVLGIFTIYRQEVRPFSDKQIALLQNFAAQAVIAMENARLITETREALEQQTATAQVLQVINSSPGDLMPIFDAMLEKAMRLCGAASGDLWTYDGEIARVMTSRGASAPFAEFLRQASVRAGPGNAVGRVLSGESFVHVLDVAAGGEARSSDPLRRAVIALGSGRTVLAVPLRRDTTTLGVFAIYRQEVRPFTDKQIALLQNFAAQAVIAMENARLLTETREALEQQTATAEVLQVINSSPGDLAPVFDAILEKARTLCGADHGALGLYEGDGFRAVAVNSPSAAFAERLREGVRAIGNPIGQPLLDGDSFVHIRDQAEIDHPVIRAAVEQTGTRTVLSVPLRKDNVLLGSITVRRHEVRPFTDKQIVLLQNFAEQAVIAMEMRGC
jgi:GAF domain-containing protein